MYYTDLRFTKHTRARWRYNLIERLISDSHPRFLYGPAPAAGLFMLLNDSY